MAPLLDPTVGNVRNCPLSRSVDNSWWRLGTRVRLHAVICPEHHYRGAVPSLPSGPGTSLDVL